ncbi:MAG: IS66 family transposase zinc-finger binding domain-containing protein [Hyphomicrobiaceae bacterium]
MPERFTREEVSLTPDGTCNQCGGALRHVGEDVTDPLEHAPGRFKVIQCVRRKLSCCCCETIHQVPTPFLPLVRRSMSGCRRPAQPRPGARVSTPLGWRTAMPE